MSATTIVIADSVDTCREALEGYILNNYSEGKLLHISATAQELLQTAKQHPPDIIITDVDLPGTCCLELCRQLLEHCPNTRIIFRAAEDMAYHARRMLKLGALGILSKIASKAEIKQCINWVLGGNIHLPRECRHLQIQKFRVEKELAEFDQQVLLLVCQGKSHEETVEGLFASSSTVRRAKERINKAAGSADRGDIIRWARQQGYISLKECWGT